MKTIIFDLGETLLYFKDIERCGDLNNSNNPCIQEVHKYLQKRGYTAINPEIIKTKLLQLRAKRYQKNIELGPEELAKYLIKEYGVDKNEMGQLIDIFSKEFFYSCYIDPCAQEVLIRLKEKYQLGIISNSPFGIPSKYVLEILEKYRIFKLFEFMIFSADELIRKPNIKIFELTFNRHNLNRKNVIYVGNHPIEDIEAAKNFGITSTVLIKRKDKSDSNGILLEDLPKYIQDNFEGGTDND